MDSIPQDFRLFWLAGAADSLGSRTSSLILPLLVLAVGGGPLQAAPGRQQQEQRQRRAGRQ